MKSIAKKSLIICLIVAVLLVVAQVASEQYYAHSLYWIANRDQTWFVANLNLFTTLRNLWSNGTLAAAAIEAFFTFCLTLLALSAIQFVKVIAAQTHRQNIAIRILVRKCCAQFVDSICNERARNIRRLRWSRAAGSDLLFYHYGPRVLPNYSVQ